MIMNYLRILISGRMLVAMLMGFSSGLPLLLTITLLQAWMKEEGIDLTTIGFMALVGLPYTLKFLWSPFIDRFTLPFLGRRRGWLLITQIALVFFIAGMGLSNPAEELWLMALMSILTSFASASQDIVIDAYRRETLADEELGLGSSLYVNGYRIAMLLASGGGLMLADHLSFSQVYLIMAACMSVGILTTLFAPEPWIEENPQSLMEAVVEPFLEYFRRSKAWEILAFILLYKIGDTMASSMTIPFYLEIGYSKTEIGTIAKMFGFWATIGGAFLGGLIMLRLGIYRALWIFGILQALSTAGFAWLANVDANQGALASVIAFENLSSGMGTSAYVAFMASMTNKKFTATQYALLTSLMGIPRVIASVPTGWMADTFGWTTFFLFCVFIALPGLLLLLFFAPKEPRLEE